MFSPPRNEITKEFEELHKERRSFLIARLFAIEEKIDLKKEIIKSEIDLLNNDIDSYNQDLVNYGGQKGFGLINLK